MESLGIADFGVTGKYDISSIDNALKKVSSLRGSMGAQTNALELPQEYRLRMQRKRIEDEKDKAYRMFT